MESALTWLTANWGTLLVWLGLAVAVLSAINSASLHWRSLPGPWYRRLLPSLIMLLTELASIRTSANASRRGWKLPLTSVPPPMDGVRIERTATISIALLTLFAAGCAGSWQDRAQQGLAATAAVTREVVKHASGDAFCRPVLQRCKVAKLNPCAALDRCHRAQRLILRGAAALKGALQTTSDGLALATEVRQ